MLAWQTLAGIVATAKEGKLLGGRWHIIWGPIRVTVGMALLMPGFGGATGGQLMVKEIAEVSSRMASTVWSRFSEAMLTSAAEVPALETLGGGQLAEQLADKVFCYSIFDAADANLANIEAQGGSVLPTRRLEAQKTVAGTLELVWPSQPVITSDTATFNFGALCGSVVVPVKLNDAAVTNSTKTWANAQILNVADALNAVAQSGLPSAMATGFFPPAAFHNPNPPRIPAKEEWVPLIETTAAKYDAAQRAAAATLINDSTKDVSDRLQGAISTDGWVAAVVYWRNLSIRQRTFMAAATSKVISVPGTLRHTFVAEFPDAFSNFDRVKMNYLPAQPGDRIAIGRDFSNEAFALTATIKDGERPTQNWVEEQLASFTAGVASTLAGASNRLTDPNADPIGALSGFGHLLTNWATAAAVGSIATSTFASGIPVLGGGLAALGALLLKPALFFLAIGVVYAYLLPMLPFIFVLLLVFGWVVLIAEALVAVIIWAFLLVRMDGQELIDGPQRAGALILLNLLIRPTLGILGLCLVFSALPILLRITNELVVPAFFVSQGTSGVALVGLAVGLLLVCYIHFQLTIRTVSLITDLPDRITRWFGHQPEGIGESRHADGLIAGATGAVVGAARSSGAAIGGARVPRKGLEDPLKGKDGKDPSDPSASRSKD